MQHLYRQPLHATTPEQPWIGKAESQSAPFESPQSLHRPLQAVSHPTAGLPSTTCSPGAAVQAMPSPPLRPCGSLLFPRGLCDAGAALDVHCLLHTGLSAGGAPFRSPRRAVSLCVSTSGVSGATACTSFHVAGCCELSCLSRA